jgi:hypothetical protein
MNQKKILVPIGPTANNLKSVHYALALADRIGAQIYILQQTPDQKIRTQHNIRFDATLQDLVNRACQNEIILIHYGSNTNLKDEIVDLFSSEHIDLLVFSEDQQVSEGLLLQVKPLVPCQIIQVREKHDNQSIGEGEEDYGACHDF